MEQEGRALFIEDTFLRCFEEIPAQIRSGCKEVREIGPGIYCATFLKDREHLAPQFRLLGIFYLGKTNLCPET